MNFYVVCGEMAEALVKTKKNHPGHEAFWQNILLYFYLLL